MKRFRNYFSLLSVFVLLFLCASCVKNTKTEKLYVAAASKTTENSGFDKVLITQEKTQSVFFTDFEEKICTQADNNKTEKTLKQTAKPKTTVSGSETESLSKKHFGFTKRTKETSACETQATSKQDTHRNNTTAKEKDIVIIASTEVTNTSKKEQDSSNPATVKRNLPVGSKEKATGIVSEPVSTQQKQTTANHEKKTEKVRVVVNCRHAVEYGADDVPRNGVIVDTEVDCLPGDTAMDALKRALNSGNIEIKESHGYVSGIAGLNEKECGGASGWMYMVNSEVPIMSADKYSVFPDDTVTFYYVTDYSEKV